MRLQLGITKDRKKTYAKATRAVAKRTCLNLLASFLIFGIILLFPSARFLVIFLGPLLFMAYYDAKAEVVQALGRDKYKFATLLVLQLLIKHERLGAEGPYSDEYDWKESLQSSIQDVVNEASFNLLSYWDFEELVEEVYSDAMRSRG